jgi:hypothetical protein
VFKEVEASRAYLADDVPWYKTQHKHSGIAFFSPAEVHDGSWKELWKTRDQALQRYYDKNPNDSASAPPHQPPPATQESISRQQKHQTANPMTPHSLTTSGFVSPARKAFVTGLLLTALITRRS